MRQAASTPFPTRALRLVFPALLLVLLLASLDQTIVSTALPTIAGEFGGLEHLSWIVSAYLLATTCVSPVYGKLGDLYGRKVVLQSAITLFLFGSALCGVSQNMGELIAFRAVQGLGGGGLIVVTMAGVGDIISPRERGRYQGYLGAVFGVSTVIGPLIGGFLVEHLSWRWIFYVNLPVGILAFLMLAWAFPKTSSERRAIDYPGAFLLAATLTGLVLLTSLGGTVLPWTSAATAGLLILTVFGLAAFLFIERRAEEPILPLDLFRNRVFSISSTVGFIVGLAMFGSVTYLPMYLQVVKGVDPATAGLQVTPMMGGVLISSIASGQIISRVGRYKAFPIAGTAIMALGLWLLSRLGVETSTALAAAYMLVLGLGLGMVMQVLVLAVQNAVPYEYLGVATSGTVLFRSIGGAVGVSLFGALFAYGLAQRLSGLEPGAALPAAPPTAAIHALPEALRASYLHAFAGALHPVFAIAALLATAATLMSLFLKEIPLKETARPSDIGDSFAMPHDATSIAEAERTVTALAERQNRSRWYEALAGDLNIDLGPARMWLLSRLAEQEEPRSRDALEALQRSDPDGLQAGLDALRKAGFLESGSTGPRRLTNAGQALHGQIVARRRSDLERLLAVWSPETHTELEALIARLARSFVAEPPPN